MDKTRTNNGFGRPAYDEETTNEPMEHPRGKRRRMATPQQRLQALTNVCKNVQDIKDAMNKLRYHSEVAEIDVAVENPIVDRDKVADEMASLVKTILRSLERSYS